MDSFTIAVVIGGAVVLGMLGMLILVDKGPPPDAPAKARSPK